MNDIDAALAKIDALLPAINPREVKPLCAGCRSRILDVAHELLSLIA